MRKSVVFLAAGLILSAWIGSQTALAQTKGFYIEPKFMYSYQYLHSPELTANSYVIMSGKSKGDSTFGGALAFGFNFKYMYDTPLRLELEYAMRSGSDVEWSWETERYNADIDIQSLFVNIYWDIPTPIALTPYVGAGLGLARLDSTYKARELSTGDYIESSHVSTNFAWNVGAGLGYDFTDNWAASLGYRFCGFGEAESETGKILGYDVKATSDVYVHETLLGLRYTF